MTTTVVVEILCVAAIAGALALGLPPAAALALGVLLIAFALLRVGGRRPSGHLDVWTRHLLRRWGFRRMPPPGPAFDGTSVGERPPPRAAPKFAQGPRPGRALSVSEATGFRWDGGTLVCAARVRPRRASATTVSVGRTDSADRLPLHTLGPLLRQFDIQLAGIDVVSLGAKLAGGGPAAQVYRRLVGPLPAIATRDTLILIRLDPAVCPAAVARRGGGTLGAVRTAKVATARVIRGLDAAGFRCELLTPGLLDESWAEFTGLGEDPAPTPSWGSVAVGGAGPARVHTTYTADGITFTSPGLARVWDTAADQTAVSLRLRPAGRPDAFQLGLVVRYVANQRVRVPDSMGLRRLDGQQLDGLCATAPRGEARLDRLCEFREMHPGAAPHLAVTTTGCGQLVGGDNSGNAITASVFGAGISEVELVGEVYLARQVVLRAIALGARVLVRTDRAHAWRPLAAELADPARLQVLVGAQPPAHWTRQFDVLVADDPAARTRPEPGGTTITVRGEGEPPSAAPDVRIRQDPRDQDRLVLEVGGQSLTASMVTIPDETRLIGQPAGSALAGQL